MRTGTHKQPVVLKKEKQSLVLPQVMRWSCLRENTRERDTRWKSIFSLCSVLYLTCLAVYPAVLYSCTGTCHAFFQVQVRAHNETKQQISGTKTNYSSIISQTWTFQYHQSRTIAAASAACTVFSRVRSYPPMTSVSQQ